MSEPRTLQGTKVRSFEKCGITVAHDGSQDNVINIEELLNYQAGSKTETESGEGSCLGVMQDNSDYGSDEEAD